MDVKETLSTRIEATRLRPGHTIRLEYGRLLNLTVDEVHVERHMDLPCVRTCGWLSIPGGEPHEYAANSRHKPTGRMRVVADRNEPPAGVEPGWNDLTRVVRSWSDTTATVWSLDDPDEPLGHGGRLRGSLHLRRGVWVWRAAYGRAADEVRGDYLTAEAAMLAATASVGEGS